MEQTRYEFGKLDCWAIEPQRAAELTVVVLHGYGMEAEDLAPFAHSIGLPVRFCFPSAPVKLQNSGRAWWPIDEEGRAAALQQGPRDLADQCPASLAAARCALSKCLAAIQEKFGSFPLILGGFSQGGMLACDYALYQPDHIAALFLLSASRLNIFGWEERKSRLQNLPVLVSHGRQDPELAFGTGERLRDFHVAAGAHVDWVPFDGGHEIPLIVWRRLRKFLTASLR